MGYGKNWLNKQLAQQERRDQTQANTHRGSDAPDGGHGADCPSCHGTPSASGCGQCGAMGQ